MTEEQKREYHRSVDQTISEYGYYATYVLADSTPSFCYSTGAFKNFKVPELIVSGLSQDISFEIIDNYMNVFRNTSIVINSKIEGLIDLFPVYLIECPNSNLIEHVLTSFRFYKDAEFTYVQAVYPDMDGHFPNDVGYDYDQEIFGTFNS